jgi:hypothetical protein
MDMIVEREIILKRRPSYQNVRYVPTDCKNHSLLPGVHKSWRDTVLALVVGNLKLDVWAESQTLFHQMCE